MAVTAIKKKPAKLNKFKVEISKELQFIKSVFSYLTLPNPVQDGNDDIVYKNENKQTNNASESEMPKRARSITELEEKLQKLKAQNNFNLKSKLVRKSLSSKLNKKLKKRERLNKTHVKTTPESKINSSTTPEAKNKVNTSKPVFNNDGKLVFSKFDFANVGKQAKTSKIEKDPRKALENIERQNEKIKKLENSEDTSKVKELKEKIQWKSVLQKAEGQKIKDDPELLKKSIKKMDQKKKHSKKQWDNRIQSVEQKKEERQKKRKENILKKKKEKKSKIIKASAKRGRVVI